MDPHRQSCGQPNMIYMCIMPSHWTSSPSPWVTVGTVKKCSPVFRGFILSEAHRWGVTIMATHTHTLCTCYTKCAPVVLLDIWSVDTWQHLNPKHTVWLCWKELNWQNKDLGSLYFSADINWNQLNLDLLNGSWKSLCLLQNKNTVPACVILAKYLTYLSSNSWRL